MGYFETHCQLCGVSPAIGRIRGVHGAYDAAWAYKASSYVNNSASDTHFCGERSSCQKITRDDNDLFELEHVARPGYASNQGYS